MGETVWTVNSEVRCRCGQIGEVTGVEGPVEFPENVWVTHRVGMSMQTHIHRRSQMPALVAQRAWQGVAGTTPAEDDE